VADLRAFWSRGVYAPLNRATTSVVSGSLHVWPWRLPTLTTRHSSIMS